MRLFDFFRSAEWRLLWPFYTSSFVHYLFLFFGPFWIIYFQQEGLAFKQISILIALLSIVPLVFEIPTGAIADALGRKFSVIFGSIAEGITVLAIPFVSNFYYLVLIFTVWGIFRTFSSGADQAWIIDLLKQNRKEKLIHNYFVKNQSIGSLAIIFMGILVGISVKGFGLKSIWIFTGLGIIASSLTLLFAGENFVKKEYRIKNVFAKTFKKAKQNFSYSWGNKNLLFLMIAMMFAYLGFSINDIAWQPFLTGLGLPVHQLGYVYSVLSVCIIGIPFLSKPLLRLIGKEKYYLVFTTGSIIILLLVTGLVNILAAGIAMMIIMNVFYELEMPVMSTFFHKLVPSRIRATTGSLRSMLIGIATAAGLIISGFIADWVGPKMTIFYSAFFVIPAIYFYLRIKSKK